MDATDHHQGIAALLVANRDQGTDWGEFALPENRPWSKKTANRFLLCCLLDYQIPSDTAWGNGYRLIDDILGDPDDIWRVITSIPKTEWITKHGIYRLHRFPIAHQRLWKIGAEVCREFGGDARLIWQGNNAESALTTLWRIGCGDQLSRMVVGALRDCHEIVAASSDVKGDVYVRRVLGRALMGRDTDAETAVRLAARLHPDDPWQLDAQLWQVGKNWCSVKNPRCGSRYLVPHCCYAQQERSG